MNNNTNDNSFVLVEFPEVQKYMDLDEFEENSYLCVDNPSAYFIDRNWKAQVDEDMEQGDYQPSYNEIANWGAEFGEAFGTGGDDVYDEALDQYITDRRNGKVANVEEFAQMYNIKMK